jgi:peroxiredoxin
MKTLLSLGLVTASFLVLVSTYAETTPARLNARVGNFTLKDTTGKAVSLASLHDKKAIVVVFIGTECPINNAYMPRLAELQKSYAPRGVQFLAVNANQQDTAERIAEHAREYAIPFPVLKDEGNHVADLFAAQRTPEAFVLDAEQRIRYRGRIDDQFGIGYKRAQPTERDLVRALDELLAGKPVSKPNVPAAGCIIARASTPKLEGSVTYTKQVARILQNKCQECHRPGEVGPMALLTYEDAVAWAETIREVIQENRMPPWYADPRFGHFENDRRLSSEERQTLLAWLDQGTPKGDDRDLPAPRTFYKGWMIGKPDVVFEMPQEYAVPADMPQGGIPYQRFRVPTNFTEDHWISRAETTPGAPSVVHHIIVWVVAKGEEFVPGRTMLLCGTAPGDMPLMLPPGYGKKIPAGADLIFEMHYTPNGTAAKDRSRVGLIFAKEEPKYLVHSQGVANDDFRIPAGDDNYEVEQWFKFRQDGYILNYMPHMHLRGKDFKYDVTYPDGRTETLLWIPRYNFNWQSVYRLAPPKLMPKGTRIHCLAHFDNSTKNANNPDASHAVTWGDQTWEEMMIGWMDLAFERKDK